MKQKTFWQFLSWQNVLTQRCAALVLDENMDKLMISPVTGIEYTNAGVVTKITTPTDTYVRTEK